MEESGENWPSDSDLEMGDDNNNDYCYDDEEELGCDEEIQYFAEDALDPIMDESQRKKKQRELEERLLALSATIPSSGFKNKKMDDRSILDNASSYVKQLQQRVRELEQQVGGGSNNNNSNKGSTSYNNEEVNSYNSNNHCDEFYYGEGGGNNINLPEVKVRVLQNEVLIIIHCEKQKGLMLKILTKLENLHLSVLNNSVLPFGKSTLDITIVAQMGDRYNMTVEELVKTLRITILTQ